MAIPVVLIIKGAALGIAAISAIVKASRKRRGKMPKMGKRVPIASAAEGQMQRIVGRLKLAEATPLIAPLSQRPCAYYEVSLLERDPSSYEDAGGWATRHFDWGSHKSLIIEDDSGEALVDLSSPSIALEMDINSNDRQSALDPSRLDAFIAKVGAEQGVVVSRERAGAYEGVLEPGETVAAYGLCSWGAAPEAGLRDNARRLTISAPPGGTVVVTDKVKGS